MSSPTCGGCLIALNDATHGFTVYAHDDGTETVRAYCDTSRIVTAGSPAGRQESPVTDQSLLRMLMEGMPV